MRQFGHFAAMAVAVVLMVALVGNLAIAGPSTTARTAAHDQYGKTPVCHATGSAKNPYVFLKAPQNSAHFSKHPDDLFGPTIASKDDCPDGNAKKAKNDSKNDAKGKGKSKAKNDSKNDAKGKSKAKNDSKNDAKGKVKAKSKAKNDSKNDAKGKVKAKSKAKNDSKNDAKGKVKAKSKGRAK